MSGHSTVTLLLQILYDWTEAFESDIKIYSICDPTRVPHSDVLELSEDLFGTRGNKY